MIGYLKGKVLYREDNNILLENNGVGYEVCCSASAAQALVSAGGGEVYVYTAVRDDGVYLYGFLNPEEKSMFLKLVSVSGVGPKVGIGVLSGMSLSSLALAIATSDVKTLSKIKGLGKKTAERIVLELREKITADGKAEECDETISAAGEIPVDEDAVIALMGLGFNRNESVAGIRAAYDAGATDIKDVLSYALRTMR
ncbi:MAG: Holliday junction branch migration protein RuvA [Bacillota bacterium]|nr:MAG: Holliday junction branch migration protein RuvA [Bacillota bacterium]